MTQSRVKVNPNNVWPYSNATMFFKLACDFGTWLSFCLFRHSHISILSVSFCMIFIKIIKKLFITIVDLYGTNRMTTRPSILHKVKVLISVLLKWYVVYLIFDFRLFAFRISLRLLSIYFVSTLPILENWKLELSPYVKLKVSLLSY